MMASSLFEDVPAHDAAIEIEELREAGEDGGDLMGYYTRGHVDRWNFAECANKYSGARSDWDRRHVDARDVQHIWWRTVPMAGQPGCRQFLVAQPKARGAFAVTVWDRLYMADFEREQRYVEDCRKARENGFRQGVNWSLIKLDEINKEAGNVLLTTFNEEHGQ